MSTALYLEASETPLPICTPNLMPFHISYSGPAPVSTYFRAKTAPPPAYGSVQAKKAAATLPEPAAESQSSTDSQDTIAAETPAATSSTASSSSLPTTVSMSSSSATLVNDVETATAGLSQVSLQQHFVAAFRGRTVRGLQVDLPEGYSGLVLQTPTANISDHKPNTSDKGKSSRRTKAKATRQSHTMEVDEMEGGGDMDHDMENDTGAEELAEELNEQARMLKPTATFSSFTLWNPDITVDEGRDEYIRSLTEWTRLAAEIHCHET